jgi:N-acetylmuramoyl-L-alanine amidase
VFVLLVPVQGQGPGTPLTLLSKEGRRPLPVSTVRDQEMVALDELAAIFQFTVREEAGAITVTYRGRTIILTPDQPLVSASGRLVSLPASPTRSGNRWMVPFEFISRALSLIYDSRLELRRPSRLVIIGDMRVPRVTIRHESLPAATRLTIDATPRTASTITQEPGRLTIRFEADALDAAIPSFQSQGLASAIRTAEPNAIVVDLGPRYGSFRSVTQTMDATSRLLLELVATTVETSTPAAPGASPGTAPGAASGSTAAAATPAIPPSELPLFGPPAAPIRTIALDPGHGGTDNGARGPDGTFEKDLTLAVARRLKAAIEARLGIRVLLTREDDRNLPVEERTAVANNNKADLLISLHANASFRPAASGASIYVAAFDDTEQASTAPPAVERVPVFGGGSRNIELVLWDFAQSRFVAESAELARILERQFQGRVPLNARATDRAPFRVLEPANMPAVLIEMGYLTNPDQEKQMATGEFQNTFVQAVFDAIVEFRDVLAAAGGGAQ